MRMGDKDLKESISIRREDCDVTSRSAMVGSMLCGALLLYELVFRPFPSEIQFGPPVEDTEVLSFHTIERKHYFLRFGYRFGMIIMYNTDMVTVNTFSRWFKIAIPTVFIAVNLFGVFHMSMIMQQDGKMSDCPFIGKTAVCNMSPLEHLATLQNMLTSTPQQSGTLTILLTLLALVFIGFVAVNVSLDTNQEIYPARRFRFEPRIFNPLQLAFARGTIHPKIF